MCAISWVHVLLTGPAKCLFEKPYFEQKKAALKPGGIICSMGKQDIVGEYDLALLMPQYGCCVMQRLKMRLAYCSMYCVSHILKIYPKTSLRLFYS